MMKFLFITIASAEFLERKLDVGEYQKFCCNEHEHRVAVSGKNNNCDGESHLHHCVSDDQPKIEPSTQDEHAGHDSDDSGNDDGGIISFFKNLFGTGDDDENAGHDGTGDSDDSGINGLEHGETPAGW